MSDGAADETLRSIVDGPVTGDAVPGDWLAPTGAAAAAARTDDVWPSVLDGILRGLTHALSNRVATIGAAAYMLEHGDLDAREGAETLRAESERLDGLVQLLRQLPARGDAEEEPLHVSDAMATAVALHAQHFELRDVGCEVTTAADVAPVLAPLHAVVHVLLLALTAVKRRALADGRHVGVQITGDADVVRVQLHLAGEAREAVSPELAAELAALRELGVLPAAPETEAGDAEHHATRAFAEAERRVRMLGGRASLDAADGSVELTLPSLGARRRAARAATLD